jgi:hypothetical protein
LDVRRIPCGRPVPAQRDRVSDIGHTKTLLTAPPAVERIVWTMADQDVISNQKTILENQKTILSNQETIKKNQTSLDEILKNQGEIVKNQEEILKNQHTILSHLKK